MDQQLGNLAAAILVAAYLLYLWALRREVPNPVTIPLWFFWVVLNAWTNLEITVRQLHWFPIAQLVCMTATFLLALRCYHRLGWQEVQAASRVKWGDSIAAAIVVTGYVIRLWFGESLAANWVLQVAVIVSFFPLIRQAFYSPKRMNPWPWITGSVAYAVYFTAAIRQGKAAMVYALVGTICHLIVWIGTLRPRSRTL